MAQFTFAPELAKRGIQALKGATEKGVLLKGPELANAQIGTLLTAEFLAADVGLVPWVEVEGDKGVLLVGGARGVIEAATKEQWEAHGPAFVAYLGAHGAIRKSLSRVPSPIEAHKGAPLGVLPIAYVVGLTVLGVASLVAGAWYASSVHEASVRVAREEARDIVASNAILESMRSELQTTGHISSDAWKALGDFAKREESAPSLMPIGLPLALGLGAAGAFAFSKWGSSNG